MHIWILYNLCLWEDGKGWTVVTQIFFSPIEIMLFDVSAICAIRWKHIKSGFVLEEMWSKASFHSHLKSKDHIRKWSIKHFDPKIILSFLPKWPEEHIKALFLYYFFHDINVNYLLKLIVALWSDWVRSKDEQATYDAADLFSIGWRTSSTHSLTAFTEKTHNSAFGLNVFSGPR